MAGEEKSVTKANGREKASPYKAPSLRVASKDWPRGPAWLARGENAWGSEAVVGVDLSPGSVVYYDLGGAPANGLYEELVSLSKVCEPEGLTSVADRVAACLVPSDEALDRVRQFVTAHGPLMLEPWKHCCPRPELEQYELALDETQTASASTWHSAFEASAFTEPADPRLEIRYQPFHYLLAHPGWEAGDEDYDDLDAGMSCASAVSWVLWEALVLRSAVNIWEAFDSFAGKVRSPSDFRATVDHWSLWRWRPLSRQRSEVEIPGALRYWHSLVTSHLAGAEVTPMFEFPPLADRRTLTEYLRLGVPSFGLTPTSLLNACWIQFYEDVQSGRGRSLICPECRVRFQPRRRDQAYCSKVCGARDRMRRRRRSAGR